MEDFKQKKYLLFDMDGTIIDPKGGLFDCIKLALSKFGINDINDSSLQKWVGPPTRDSFIKFYGFSESDADIAVNLMRNAYATKGISNNTLYHNIDEVIKLAKMNGKQVVLASSKPKVYALDILKQHSLLEYFTYVGDADFDGKFAEQPDNIMSHKAMVILDCMNALSMDVKDALMIGDTIFDIEGANFHKMHSVGVGYGYGEIKELKRAGATITVQSVNDLQKLLFG
ncbi:MAG: HAD hydrolase-like protein [Clostridiales bacterium]|nr:HAD hydrolase-like protein [Clostridiales bacterium]